MGRSVVTRLETAAFAPGRNSQAWTARSANSPVTADYKTSSTNGGFQGERNKRTSVSSTGEWCLAVMLSPGARRVGHTARASGTDAI